ncbi:serine/threonine kinase-like domain-containing protein STKLD1 [Tubulanus polymorphus]|uniref:serine/threonine kinase-like domain-containing protein STKLD1 n=1 Tax=Tubulanus polymorphus TaxID=672921 RepID=UPI003DA4B06E
MSGESESSYRMLQRLGKGAQGAVYLVEHKEEGKQYVLKKVECRDESEANKAFKEAVALAKLQHVYICGYKEFYVMWDKDECAMYVCIIMEYYKHGDLDKILKQKRKERTPIEEIIIKKWLGQMVEALLFIHHEKVIHRDLKPSNIFMQEDLSISLGDFGVATVMDDSRTKTRTAIGSMNWMAPEVMERPYDERSDVWSLGCIILEMTTCGFLDTNHMMSKLFELKSSQEVLEETLQEVSKTYSVELVSVIRAMLRRNFKQRPSSEELVEFPYVKDCLALSGSALAEQRKKSLGKGTGGPVPRGSGVAAIIKYLETERGHESCVKDGLEYLYELSNNAPLNIDNSGKILIANLMKENIASKDILVSGCNVLQSMVPAASENDALFSDEIVLVVIQAMKAHGGSLRVQMAGAALLVEEAANDESCSPTALGGAVGVILDAMRTFTKETTLLLSCTGALLSLSINENTCKLVTTEKGMQDVCNCMDLHKTNPELVASAAKVIAPLLIDDDNLQLAKKLDLVPLLIEAIHNHFKEADVVEAACMALTDLIYADEEHAYLVLNCSRSHAYYDGIFEILKAYNEHKDNVKVIENIVTVIMELAEYVDIKEELKSQNVVSLLNQIKGSFTQNKDIMNPCTQALQLLGAATKR